MVATAETLGEPSCCGDVQPARRADGQAAPGKLARCGHGLSVRDRHGITESDRDRVEELAHALHDARYPADDFGVTP